MVLDILINTLGKPKHNPYKGQVNFEFNCPRCADENFGEPDNKYNLGVLLNGNEQKFNCWKCEYKGPLKRLVYQYANYQDIKQYKELHLDSFVFLGTRKIQTKIEKVQLPNEFISLKNPDVNDHNIKKALKYLSDRKITKKLINFFNIGVCLEGRYQNRIIIPSYDKKGELTYFVGRSFIGQSPTYLNPKIDKDTLIFNEHNINWNHTIYIVEGVFDMLSLPINTIALIGKIPSKRLIDNLIKFKPNIVLLLDEDATKDADNLKYKFDLYGIENVKMVRVKNKDLNNILTVSGDTEIKKLISSYA